MGKTKELTIQRKKEFKDKMKLKAKERKQNLKEKRSRLMVKNLPFTANEDNLKVHFERFGKVTNVHLLKKEDGKMMGCGFIQYEAVTKAAKAKHYLNGKEFLGRAIEVEFTIPKKDFEKKVWKEKRQKFLEEQKIKEEAIDVDIKIEDDEVVTEEKPEEKEEIETDQDDEQEMGSNKSESEADEDEKEEKSSSEDEDGEEEEENDSGVEEVKEPEEEKEEKKARFESHDVNEGKTVFIKNLPFEAQNEDLKECMMQFGPVYYALVCMDKSTEHSKGTGFVKFIHKDDSDKCLQAGTELSLMGTILDCHAAIDRKQVDNKLKDKEKAKQRDSRNLYLIKEGVILAGSKAAEGVSASDMGKRLQLEQYKSQMLRNLNMYVSKTRLIVHNLPATWDDSKLRALLKKHAGPGAAIKESRIMRNMRSVDEQGVGLSKEHGFVTFTMHEHALNALRSLNNNPHAFSEAKRPIVAFSIENRVMVNAKQKRMDKSRLLNPLAKQYNPEVKKEHQDWKKQKNEEVQPGRNVRVIEGGEFAGSKGKPGAVQKMRSRYKLKTQAKLHQEQLKNEKKQKKNVTKTLQQRKEDFIRQDAQKVNKNKRSKEGTDDNFGKMVNFYKRNLLKNNEGNKFQTRGKWTDGDA